MKYHYEVIRVIQQDSKCHIIMDYVEGEILGEYLLRYPYIEKKQLFAWFFQLLKQLQELEKVNGISDYRFLTPFSIVLKADQTIALLNLKAGANLKCVEGMTKYSFMNRFYPPSGSYNDIYSFGKTMQFLLAKTNLTPRLTWREELGLQSIISKCLTEKSKKQYQSFYDIAMDFPIHKKKQGKKLIKAGMIAVLFLGVIWRSYHNMEDAPITKEEEKNHLEIGIAYFLILEDYEKSRELFEDIKYLEPAPYYEKMCSYMLGDKNYTVKEMEQILQEFSQLWDGNLGIEEKSCLMRVYSKMDSEYARKQLLDLGEDIIEELEWDEMGEEVREIVAGAYSKDGDHKKALEHYEMLLCERHGAELYHTMSNLYVKCEDVERAMELCIEGMKYNQQSSELELLYIRLLCQDGNILKEEKQAKIKEIIESHPKLLDERRFQTLQKEYGIKVEGGEVWFEN